MRDIRVGVIGTGSIVGDRHVPAIKGVVGGQLHSILTRDDARGSAFLAAHGASEAKVFTSIDEFVADEALDTVIIASPDRLHSEHASRCLEAGKDILLEKPMAVTADEAASLHELARRTNRILMMGFHLRWHNGHRKLYQERHRLGTLHHIRASWAFAAKNGDNWRASSALGKWWSLAAVGCHCMDIARWFAGDADDWIQFRSVISNSIWHGPHDETAVISAQFAGGPTLEIMASVQFDGPTRLELYGAKGCAIADGTFGRQGAGRIVIAGEEATFDIQSPFIPQLAHFYECVRERRQPETDGAVGVRSVRDLLLAADT